MHCSIVVMPSLQVSNKYNNETNPILITIGLNKREKLMCRDQYNDSIVKHTNMFLRVPSNILFKAQHMISMINLERHP